MTSAELAKQIEVVKIFAGKAAPAYAMAKAIIHLIVKVSEVINHDSSIQNKLKIVFVPNYNVSLAELIIPAADVSEHISTVGTEASGTRYIYESMNKLNSNMKFSLNGALLLCTMDGSSIEIANEIGEENVYVLDIKFLVDSLLDLLLINNMKNVRRIGFRSRFKQYLRYYLKELLLLLKKQISL